MLNVFELASAKRFQKEAGNCQNFRRKYYIYLEKQLCWYIYTVKWQGLRWSRLAIQPLDPQHGTKFVPEST